MEAGRLEDEGLQERRDDSGKAVTVAFYGREGQDIDPAGEFAYLFVTGRLRILFPRRFMNLPPSGGSSSDLSRYCLAYTPSQDIARGPPARI